MKSNQWFRFYTEVLNDPKVQCLPPDLFKHWVNILCTASKNDGAVPDAQTLSFMLRETLDGALTVLERLSTAGLLDKVSGGTNGWHYAPHGWNKRQFKSDTSTERVKRFREKPSNVTETSPETDTEAYTDTELFRDDKSSPRMLGEAPRQSKMTDAERQRDAQFEIFWSAFPKQRPGSKSKARKSFWNAFRRATIDEIMAGLERYSSSEQVARGFAKGCAAWLNDDGWTGSYAPEIQIKVAPQPQPSKWSETY